MPGATRPRVDPVPYRPLISVSDPTAADLARQLAPGDLAIPPIARDLNDGLEPELIWRNELGGLTFRLGDRYLKWNPPSTGVDLERERQRLEWISRRHPAPVVLASGVEDGAQWLLTQALPGGPAVGDKWRARRPEAIRAIAAGLRAIHAIPIDDVPRDWTAGVWVVRQPTSLGPRPPIEHSVLVHGDACAPNTLVSDDGTWTGNVDFGDLSLGDRWADLAVASLSLEWNFGPGHESELFDAYEIDPDQDRITYYRALWRMES